MNKTTAPQAAAAAKRGFQRTRVGYPRYAFIRLCYFFADLVLLIPAIVLALVARLSPRPVDIGIGPVPSINSRHHKRALELQGYRCETYVYYLWYFTQEFDVNLGRLCPRALGPYAAYVFALFRYRCLYLYFNGGPLGFTSILARLEPYLYRLSGIRTVVMPFGADIHELSRSKNLQLVHGYARDYPGFRHSRRNTANLIDTWTQGADHIISGCDWVDYLYYWDTLMLAHFAIDETQFAPAAAPAEPDAPCRPLRILHAPNHRNIKGTDRVIAAVEALQHEGVEIELVILEGVPNSQVPDVIRSVDVVVDQLIIGWYAMFALESMSLGKPVVCHIRPEYEELYVGTGLIAPGELPLIDATTSTIEATLRTLAGKTRGELYKIGQRSRRFVEEHHSLRAIGQTFAEINRQIGIVPRK